MNFFDNLFNSENNTNSDDSSSSKNEPSSVDEYGKFSIKDFPKEDELKDFYFFEYHKNDGEKVEENEPICKIRIGESAGYFFKSANIIASKSGVLEIKCEKDDLLEEGQIIYILHPVGEYKNENSINKSEFKHYFDKEDNSSFDKWFVQDGQYIVKESDVYSYKDSSYKRHIHKSKRNGFINLNDPFRFSNIRKNELIYTIRDSDEIRIKERYENTPDIIVDEFTDTKIIKWFKISSKFPISEVIKIKSDDYITELGFSFNFFQGNDYIIFHFNPKEIRPRQSDIIYLLFENGDKIEFLIKTNPVAIKNRLDKKVLEFKTILTAKELDLFANENFKKWKIFLKSDNREILGGDFGGDENYKSKYNLQVVIKKLANEYIGLIQEQISDYQPTILEKGIKSELPDISNSHCYVYLMLDNANNYYKIGISNKPKYREKTLQSEKPTIELIVAKKFPIRKIAESFEKSLHEVYSAKRIRGEWFELNSLDVIHIKMALE